MSEETATPSEEAVVEALDAVTAEYEKDFAAFLEGFQKNDTPTVLSSIMFFIELLAKIEIINEILPHLKDEAVKAKAVAAANRYEEMLKGLEDAAHNLEQVNGTGDSEDFGFRVIGL